MILPFKSVSLSHRTAPLAIREMLALNEEESKGFYVKCKDLFGLNELLIVSTCNRTEFYYTSDRDISTDLIKAFLIEKGLTNTAEYLGYFKQMDETEDSLRHLFEVATGLQSKVVGDLQIPNQIKKAYQQAADSNMAGPYLHRLMHTIFYSNKRVAQETSFRDGAASVSYATVALAEELSQALPNPKVLILGLGEIGLDVCKNMEEKDFAEFTIMNRTIEKAEKIAAGKELFRVAPLSDLWKEIAAADIIISSVRTDSPIITQAEIKKLQLLSFKYFIDLSVPRSIEDGIEKINGVLLYNIDTLKERADEALATRLASIPEVKTIIEESIISFNDWSKEMEVSPTINKLKNALEQIRKEELNRHMKGLTKEETEKLEKITAGLVQKIIKQPIIHLKAACKRGDSDKMVDVLNDLFNLESFEEIES
ncbi:MAG: glutamyl-tRNA reductase [Cytophagales bacterium]|jgi:glutamyl-tRNA reductase|nr:glutamyl-tRNA reductase [Cytophagales bacterium]